MPLSNEAAAESLIERYHQDSLDSGARIRDGLSKAVEQAIRDFANGFLAHPANDELRQSIADGKLSPETYYQHLLRLIYRLLFLLVIEERDLIFLSLGQQPAARRFSTLLQPRTPAPAVRKAPPRRQTSSRSLAWRCSPPSACSKRTAPVTSSALAPLAGDLFSHAAIGPLAQRHVGQRCSARLPARPRSLPTSRQWPDHPRQLRRAQRRGIRLGL
jgi:hypothetical protein